MNDAEPGKLEAPSAIASARLPPMATPAAMGSPPDDVELRSASTRAERDARGFENAVDLDLLPSPDKRQRVAERVEERVEVAGTNRLVRRGREFDPRAMFASLGATSMTQAIEEGTYEASFGTGLLDTLVLRGPTPDRPHDEHSEEEETDDTCCGSEASFERGVEVAGRATDSVYPRVCGVMAACRHDSHCYRRDTQHWLQFAHPAELLKPYCPALARGDQCFNKGPSFESHNATYSHGPLPSAFPANEPSTPSTPSTPGQPAGHQCPASYGESHTCGVRMA